MSIKRDHTIDDLFREDADASLESRKVLRSFDPWACDGLDEAARIYRALFEAEERLPAAHDEDVRLRQVAAQLGITFERFEELIRAKDACVAAHLDQYWAFKALDVGTVLKILCARQYRWLATDLLRGRVTAAIGYVRLQSEAVALMHLFLERPTETDSWLVAGTTEDGKVFYTRTQKTLIAIMKRLHLVDAYDWGSANALHCRIVTIKRGHAVRRKAGDSPLRPYLWLKDHEFSLDDPLPLVEVTIRILAAQAHLLNGIIKARQGIDLKAVRAMIVPYGMRLKNLCDKLDAARK